jgi:hypothetical protein
MASFTDIIPQFNPYIQQLPVDAMVRVGMQKQAQYDAGVQKIQSYIDNVAGLDVVKGVDRQYLQSKLDELGNNLKGVAAGDFSNFQLVNSVGGMVKQVVKDPVIQGAVSSTQRYRRGQAEAEEARKSGKGSAQNEAWWLNQANSWLNDDTPGSSFTGEYVPYTDLTKKWMDIQKELGASETTQQLPFLQDAAGRYIDEEGNLLPAGSAPVLNKVMIEKTFKGKSAQAIKNAIMASMNENDIRQINIDAWYHYRGTTPEKMRANAIAEQAKYDGNLTEQLKNLQVLKGTRTNDPIYQAAVDKQIKEAQEDIAENKANYERAIELIKTNPDAYRNAMYTQNAINSFALGFSNYTEIQKIVSSPYQEQLDRDRKYSLSVDEYKERQRHNKATENLSWLNYQLEVSKAQKEAKGSGMIIPGVLDIAADKSGFLKTSTFAFMDDLAQMETNIKNQKLAFKSANFPTYSEEQFNQEYAYYYDQYNKGNQVGAEWVQLFDGMKILNTEYNNKNAVLQTVLDEADRLPQFAEIKGMGKKVQADRLQQEVRDERAKSLGLYTRPKIERRPDGTPVRGVEVAVYSNDPAIRRKQELYNQQTTWINNRLNEKLVATYAPQAFSFDQSDDKKKAFVRAGVNQYITRIENEGGQEKGRFTEGFDLATAKTLLNKPGTIVGGIRQGKDVYITLQGSVKEGEAAALQVIRTTPAEFERVFRESPVAAYQDDADLLFQFGNTNPQSGSVGASVKQNPNAYKTPRYQKLRGSGLDKFPMVQGYNLGADIISLPSGYQAVFYIQDPITKQPVVRESAASPSMQALIEGFSLMTDTNVKNLLK